MRVRFRAGVPFAASVFCAAVFLFISVTGVFAEDISGAVRKAVEQSTLDEEGTRPFHLHARVAPSLDRDKSSGRTGEVELWWQSPQHWRREVRTNGFHQVEIVNGAGDWQKNDGDYFPEWLREIAVALVRPVPIPTDQLLTRVKSAEVRHIPMSGQINVDWDQIGAPGNEQVNGKGYLAFYEKSGMLFYTGGPGWDGMYKDFADFHGRQVARTVSGGSPEVTSKIDVLEDLAATPAGFFDAEGPGRDPAPIRTVVLSEAELRAQLATNVEFRWPTVLDGPFEGIVRTSFVLDRTGQIREMGEPVSDNPGLRNAAAQQFQKLQFQPVVRDGVPVQAIAEFSVPFKTSRPAGIENLDTARHYFEQGRKTSYLAYNNGPAYVMKGELQIGTSQGVETGRYEDTWLSSTEWRREAWLGSNHVARARIGDQYYRLAEGPDPRAVQFILTAIEPIPTTDTMTESDWRVRRVVLNGTDAIRVIRGPENPDGTPQDNAQAFWFAPDGHLLKSFSNGFEIMLFQPEPYLGLEFPRTIGVLRDGKLGMRIVITEIGPATADAGKKIALKGHEWKRAFTSDER